MSKASRGARPTTPSRHVQPSPSPSKKLSMGEASPRSPDRRLSNVRTPTNLKPGHWSKELKEVTLVTQHDGMFNFRVLGGSDHGEFPVVVEVMPPDTRGVEYLGEGDLTTQDVLLEIQGQKVAGYTQGDVVAWLSHCSRNGNPVVLRTAPQGRDKSPSSPSVTIVSQSGFIELAASRHGSDREVTWLSMLCDEIRRSS